MKIDFFNAATGALGGPPPNGMDLTIVTTKTEANFMFILHTRGFLDGRDPATALAVARNPLWLGVQDHLPESNPLKTTDFDPALTLPVGTELHLSLQGDAYLNWGKATLSGESINKAMKAIKIVLKAGRCFLAHSGGVALLNHVLNTPLRNSLNITLATVADLDKPITGDLYFRAMPVTVPPIPVAPDGSGKTKLSTWPDDLEAFIYQASTGLDEVQRLAHIMMIDLSQLEKFRNQLEGIFQISMMYYLRDVDTSQSTFQQFLSVKNSLISKFAVDFRQNVLIPAGPSGHFGFDWTLQNTQAGKTFAWIQTKKNDAYEPLVKDYKLAPAARIGLVNRTCDLELQMLCALAADGDPGQVVRNQVASASAWLASPTGDPPDAAGGAGILLGMMAVTLPQGVPVPQGLLRLNMGVIALDGLLSAAQEATQAARETRIKGAVATLLKLSGDSLHQFLNTPPTPDVPSGSPSTVSSWDYLVSAAGVRKESAAGVRVAQIPQNQARQLVKANQAAQDAVTDNTAKNAAAVQKLMLNDEAIERLENLDDAAQGAPPELKNLLSPEDLAATKYAADSSQDELAAAQAVVANTQGGVATAKTTIAQTKTVVAWIRVLGFCASGVAIANDILAIWDKDGEKKLKVKLAKDGLSCAGSLVRDFVSTHLALAKGLSAADKAKWEVLDKGFVVRRIGGAFGVASGVWTFYDGVQKKDVFLEAGGAFGVAGYGLRMFFIDGLVVAGFEITVPLLLIGAGFELWAGAQPTPPDEAMKSQTMNMINGLVQATINWYGYGPSSTYTPWRGSSPDMEAALQNAKQAAAACEGGTTWTAFLPADLNDAAAERTRLVSIGFTADQANKLIPDELGVKYVVRGKAPALFSLPFRLLSLEDAVNAGVGKGP
jgi:hypothetical protein